MADTLYQVWFKDTGIQWTLFGTYDEKGEAQMRARNILNECISVKIVELRVCHTYFPEER